MKRMRILGVVGLHSNTFKPFTNTKTSVLLAQKLQPGEELDDDYPIFCAVNKVPLKDTSGSYLFQLDAGGDYILDTEGRPMLNHDLDQIAEGFGMFCAEHGVSLGE